MNILFLSLTSYNSLSQHNIYTDLLRELVKNGHVVYAVCPVQRRLKQATTLTVEPNAYILRVRTGNITRTNLIEKGVSTLLLTSQFIRSAKKHFSNVNFDMILYPTPPVTLRGVVKYFKKRTKAITYLLLKDIFPQNAVDIGMMSKTGGKGVLYRYFRRVEKRLYGISDRIGCMSQANVAYLLAQNPEIDPSKVEICPNSIEIQDMTITTEERCEIREKYGIPQNKKVFVYGGNLGKPQGIPFIIECLKTQQTNEDAYFLIVGDGTEYSKLDAYFAEARPANMKLMKRLPKEDYDRMVAACDVGMIFLDHRFTIPNFPSRLLGYMQAGLPVLACTDPNTDIGQVISAGGFGWWCESNDTVAFSEAVCTALSSDSEKMKQQTLAYLHDHYTVAKACQTILANLEGMDNENCCQ